MQLPPPEVVHAHHEGKPITVALLKRMEAEQAKGKRRGRARKGKWTDPHKPQKQTEKL